MCPVLLLTLRVLLLGIHDCCPPKENVTQMTYVKNLGIIYEAARAALAPGGKILWVSTTPVPTADGAAPQPFTCGRSGHDFNTCIDDYNAAGDYDALAAQCCAYRCSFCRCHAVLTRTNRCQP